MHRLRKLREDRNMSQKALGELLGVSQQNIHKYEAGITEPNTRMLLKIADEFHISVDYLLGRDTADTDWYDRIDAQKLQLLSSFEKCSPEIRSYIAKIVDELAQRK